MKWWDTVLALIFVLFALMVLLGLAGPHTREPGPYDGPCARGVAP